MLMHVCYAELGTATSDTDRTLPFALTRLIAVRHLCDMLLLRCVVNSIGSYAPLANAEAVRGCKAVLVVHRCSVHEAAVMPHVPCIDFCLQLLYSVF